MGKIIYPGTFDPITKGHIDIVERALHIFDEVIIGVAANVKKDSSLTLDQRFQLVQQVLKKYDHVRVEKFSGLLIDFAQQQNVFVVLRGLRAVSDFEYEFQLANTNRALDKRLETVFLTPAEQYAYISSSMVREIASLGGNVSAFVPEEVSKLLVFTGTKCCAPTIGKKNISF